MEFPRFQIKICGITAADDAEMCVAEGADALGLNFYLKSARYLQPEAAPKVVAAIPSSVLKIGLFVNASVSDILAAQAAFRLDAIQLHGDEPPEFLAKLRGIPLMRAFRCGPDLSPVFTYLTQCRELQAAPGAVLLDAFQAGQYGGTGKLADWDSIAALRDEFSDYHLVLAGGLTAANVAQAIAAVRPDAIDTASGVELSPGRKSPADVAAFVKRAAGAFDGIGRSGNSDASK